MKTLFIMLVLPLWAKIILAIIAIVIFVILFCFYYSFCFHVDETILSQQKAKVKKFFEEFSSSRPGDEEIIAFCKEIVGFYPEAFEAQDLPCSEIQEKIKEILEDLRVWRLQPSMVEDDPVKIVHMQVTDFEVLTKEKLEKIFSINQPLPV